MEQHIVIGKIVAPHGVRGEFRIMPLTEHPERYADRKKVRLDNGRELTVLSLRQHKNVLLMQTQEVTTMDEAELLRGREIVVEPDELPPLPEGQFYVRDILGFTVSTPDGTLVGTMKDVITPATTDVFVIATPEGKELMVAAIEDNILDIDWEKRTVTVRLPEWI